MKEKIKKNQERNCPEWFQCVACVILYNSDKKILLGKRRKEEKEGGKWAILGGSGAFEESKSPRDFAKRELKWDIKINKIDCRKLRYFATISKQSQGTLTIENYFYYKYDEKNKKIKVTGKYKSPEKVKWFSIEKIRNSKEECEIAFNNGEILEKFWNEILLKF